MKVFFLTFLFFQYIFVDAQFLSSEIDWFGNESFFNDSIVKQHKIAAIHIWDSEKKDGKHFQDEKAFLHYEFNKKGRLTTSYKAIVLSNKIDTAIFQYSYNQRDQLYKRSEKQGPFHFNFFYFYNGSELVKEVKINVVNQSIDTAFVHYFEIQKKEQLKRVIIQNSTHRAFMQIDSEYDEDGQLVKYKKSYVRNQNFSETTYQYKADQLALKTIISIGRKKTYKIAYSYKDSNLHLVEHFEGENLQRKYGFTYNKERLPKAIIERDLENKKIKIYRLEYLYYED